MEAAEYLDLAKEIIPALLHQELAAPWLEVEARVADQRYGAYPSRVEPHHLSQARYELAQERVITSWRAGTRGGRSVVLWRLTNVDGSQKAVERAAARKRLLTARYLGWASGSASRPGITGNAAEQVVHASILDAAPHGFALASPSGPGVSHFLGMPVPIGPLDSATIRTAFTDGLPTGHTAIPIEVKNLRDWIYRTSRELYQLLDKAAQIQNARPTVDIAPVLVCRQAHITTMRMAKTLGFFVIPTLRQYISPTADGRLVEEVRTELGFIDLVATSDADKRITTYLV